MLVIIGKRDKGWRNASLFIFIKRGFTLVELMTAVAIIAVLVAMLLPRVGLLIDRSRERTTAKNLKNIYAAICQYAERKYGRMVFPAISSNPNEELVRALTSPDVNPQGPPFDDEVPPALLRRRAGDAMGGGMWRTQNNKFYAASGRSWNSIAPNNQNKGGWIYITSGTYTGEIFINSNVCDTFNVIYSTYPCW